MYCQSSNSKTAQLYNYMYIYNRLSYKLHALYLYRNHFQKCWGAGECGKEEKPSVGL